MHFETSPGSSPSKSMPISFGNMSSPTGSLYSNYSSTSSSSSSRASTCAYPSWPSGTSLGYRSAPSSFISDADLFGDDLVDNFSASPYLQEAPAPPRQPPMGQQSFLPPIYASEKPKKQQRRRSSGDRKQRRSSKPMTPISESPEAQRE